MCHMFQVQREFHLCRLGHILRCVNVFWWFSSSICNLCTVHSVVCSACRIQTSEMSIAILDWVRLLPLVQPWFLNTFFFFFTAMPHLIFFSFYTSLKQFCLVAYIVNAQMFSIVSIPHRNKCKVQFVLQYWCVLWRS